MAGCAFQRQTAEGLGHPRPFREHVYDMRSSKLYSVLVGRQVSYF